MVEAVEGNECRTRKRRGHETSRSLVEKRSIWPVCERGDGSFSGDRERPSFPFLVLACRHLAVPFVVCVFVCPLFTRDQSGDPLVGVAESLPVIGGRNAKIEGFADDARWERVSHFANQVRDQELWII